MILEFAAIGVVAAAAVAFRQVLSEQRELHRRIDNWVDATRTENNTLSTSLGNLKDNLGMAYFSSSGRRPARYDDLDELRAEIAQLADALGLVRENAKHVPARFVAKGGPERE